MNHAHFSVVISSIPPLPPPSSSSSLPHLYNSATIIPSSQWFAMGGQPSLQHSSLGLQCLWENPHWTSCLYLCHILLPDSACAGLSQRPFPRWQEQSQISGDVEDRTDQPHSCWTAAPGDPNWPSPKSLHYGTGVWIFSDAWKPLDSWIFPQTPRDNAALPQWWDLLLDILNVIK